MPFSSPAVMTKAARKTTLTTMWFFRTKISRTEREKPKLTERLFDPPVVDVVGPVHEGVPQPTLVPSPEHRHILCNHHEFSCFQTKPNQQDTHCRHLMKASGTAIQRPGRTARLRGSLRVSKSLEGGCFSKPECHLTSRPNEFNWIWFIQNKFQTC